MKESQFEHPILPTLPAIYILPLGIMPSLLARGMEWKKSSGRGQVYTYTIVRKSYLPEFAHRVPYIYALVELEEGIRIPSNIIDCPVEQVKIGLPVELAWAEADFGYIPVFRPAEL